MQLEYPLRCLLESENEPYLEPFKSRECSHPYLLRSNLILSLSTHTSPKWSYLYRYSD
jgi:hypothetical protein